MNIASDWVKKPGNRNWTGQINTFICTGVHCSVMGKRGAIIGQINTYTRTAVRQLHIVLSEENIDSTNELLCMHTCTVVQQHCIVMTEHTNLDNRTLKNEQSCNIAEIGNICICRDSNERISTFFGILSSWNSHPFPRSTQLRSSVYWRLEIAILSLVVRSLSCRSSPVSCSTRAAFVRGSSDKNRLFFAFRLGIRIGNLLNRYPETTTSVTTECKMWISQVRNCNHRLSRLPLDYRHW